jgi:tetratricopeptide (TPR) repeat protein
MKSELEQPLVGRLPNFRPVKRPNAMHIMVLIGLILVGVWMLLGLQRGEIISPYLPTPTATRSAASFFEEAEAYFQAGKLDDPDPPLPTPPRYDAIDTYQRALQVDPNNALAWANLARIQTYSSSLMSNDADRQERLSQALESINKAVELNSENSEVRAIRAFVLDWNASSSLITDDQRQAFLTEAQNEALRAYQLDHENALSLAFYAEVLLDQQNWTQAEQYAAQAVALSPDSMDAHRVYATVLESVGQYNSAIKEYLKAAEINPNLTFLYVYIGRNYTSLKLYDRALEYFAHAANLNAQIGVKNSTPYIEIAKVYSQQGEFFVAAVNAEKGLSFDPTNANTYGQLGIIYIRSRNYEGAMPVLQCAVIGCTAEENEGALNLVDSGLLDSSVAVEGLPLTNLTVAYYYVEYGTVLAFLSRENQNFCSEARPILNQVRAAYPGDSILMGIVADSEGICDRLEGAINALPSPTPVLLPTDTPSPGN